MPAIKILDEKRYPLPRKNNPADMLPYYRWEHRATLGRSGRTFLVFLDNGISINNQWLSMPEMYIEEITSGHMKVIDDDQLFKEIHEYAERIGLLMITYPMAKE